MVKNFTSKKQIGNFGELIALNTLKDKGFKILEQNYHFSREAEIDIIALKDKVLHFVEVKTRSQTKFGTPFEAVDKRKLDLIYKASMFYIQQNKVKFDKFQIDVVGILLKNENDFEIKIIENVSL